VQQAATAAQRQLRDANTICNSGERGKAAAASAAAASAAATATAAAASASAAAKAAGVAAAAQAAATAHRGLDLDDIVVVYDNANADPWLRDHGGRTDHSEISTVEE
jgi:hypothetical protein